MGKHLYFRARVKVWCLIAVSFIGGENDDPFRHFKSVFYCVCLICTIFQLLAYAFCRFHMVSFPNDGRILERHMFLHQSSEF